MNIIVKNNMQLKDIKFTANAIVLVKINESFNEKNGEVNTKITAIEIDQCKNNSGIEVVKTLLRFLLAEYRVNSNFEHNFRETKIKQSNVIKPFLNSTVIFKANSEGLLTKAVVSEVKLNKTALNIKPTHKLILCQGKNLKAALHQHASAIIAQCCYISAIKAEAANIEKVLLEAVTTKAEDKKERAEKAKSAKAAKAEKAEKEAEAKKAEKEAEAKKLEAVYAANKAAKEKAEAKKKEAAKKKDAKEKAEAKKAEKAAKEAAKVEKAA